MQKFFECEHCRKGFAKSTNEEIDEHRTNCPAQHANPAKRFKARLGLMKKKDDLKKD